jgi:hypothetical protein
MPRLTIRTRLMLVFTTLFIVFFGGAVYWFYQFATQKVMTELRQSLVISASTAASMISADEHAQVFQSGVEDNASYKHLADQLRLVRDANPEAAAVYTAIRSADNPTDLLFVVSADENPATRVHLGEVYDASNAPEMLKALTARSRTWKWVRTNMARGSPDMPPFGMRAGKASPSSVWI